MVPNGCSIVISVLIAYSIILKDLKIKDVRVESAKLPNHIFLAYLI